MPPSPEEQEAKVRPLREAGLSTRKIADALDISQPTVVRTLKRINTGPQPIQRAEDESADSSQDTQPMAIAPSPAQKAPSGKTRRESSRVGHYVVLGVMVLVFAAIAGAVWYRLAQTPASAPAAVPRLPVCAWYSSTGQIVRLVLATNNYCGEGWRLLILSPVK